MFKNKKSSNIIVVPKSKSEISNFKNNIKANLHKGYEQIRSIVENKEQNDISQQKTPKNNKFNIV